MGSNARGVIGVKKTTKARMDENRAPGQTYDGFIRQLIDLWEKTREERLSEVMPISINKK